MKQLSPLDSVFYYQENGNQFMHIAGLSIYDPSTAPDKFRKANGEMLDFQDILTATETALWASKTSRQKLVPVPGNLDHPYWVEDENFDIEFHVRHVALPKPGDWHQLCDMISRLHSRPLDMTRPLWEAYVIEGLDHIEGLPEGCFAIYTKTHHAAIDGATGADLIAAMHSLSPEDEPPAAPPGYEWKPEKVPSSAELLIRTHFNNMRKPQQAWEVLREALPGFLEAGQKWATGQIEQPRSAPRTRFNHAVSANRTVEGRAFNLDTIKAMRKAVDGATVNDAVISVVGGALRKYLESKDELPDKSLVAFVPINVRKPGEEHAGGNVVSGMTAPIGSDIKDPVERLRFVHAGTQESKELAQAVGARNMIEFQGLTPAALAALGSRVATASTVVENISNPPANLTITNVPGPQIPLYMSGAKLLQTYGLGPLVNGQGLFVSISSYNGIMTITATADRAAIDDPEFFADCLEEAYLELKDATLGISTRSDLPAVKTTAKRKMPAKAPAAKKKPAPKKKAAVKKPAAKKKAQVKKKTAAKATPNKTAAE